MGHQLSGEGRYTHGTAFENAACSSSCYVQKARASRARVVVLWGSLGLEGKGLLYDEGWEEERKQTRKLIGGYNNRTEELTDCCAAAQLAAAAVLCPHCCCRNLATPLARAQQEQEGVRIHPTAVGIAIIAATAVLSIAPVEAIWIRVQRRLCPCASGMPSTPRRLYPFRLFAQETEHKISAWCHFTPSRYLTRAYHVSRKYRICDRDIRLDRHIIWL